MHSPSHLGYWAEGTKRLQFPKEGVVESDWGLPFRIMTACCGENKFAFYLHLGPCREGIDRLAESGLTGLVSLFENL